MAGLSEMGKKQARQLAAADSPEKRCNINGSQTRGQLEAFTALFPTGTGEGWQAHQTNKGAAQLFPAS